MDQRNSASKRISPFVAVILAAGSSERMGHPKWAVQWHGRPFWGWIHEGLETFQSLHARMGRVPAVIILSPEESTRFPSHESGWQVVVNPRPGSEPLDSLRIALKFIARRWPSSRYLFIWPVDYPAVNAEVLERLWESAQKFGKRAHEPRLWRPVFQNQGGHPILINKRLALAVAASRGVYIQGLRGFLIKHRVPVFNVCVATPTILWNFNTPRDLSRVPPEREPNHNSGV